MRRSFLACLVGCAIAGVAMGADTTPPKKAAVPAQKTAPVKVAAKKATPATVPKAGATRPGTATGASRTSAGAPRTATGSRTTQKRYYARQQPVRRVYSAQQTSPTADRYREIQDALAAKGYLKTPSTGVWDKDSIDAMQRFQQDQKLEPTGKLTARSLGALGLGPSSPVASAMPAGKPGADASPLQ